MSQLAAFFLGIGAAVLVGLVLLGIAMCLAYVAREVERMEHDR